MQKEMEWTILDVDEEEWQRRTGTMDTAAAANGFPVVADPQKGESNNAYVLETNRVRQRSRWRQVPLAVAGVLVLLSMVSYSVWHTAQQGITRIERDVANAVKLETIKAQVRQPELHKHTRVETIEFLNDKAMVQALITRTLPSGHVAVHRQTLFYAQTPQGWQRTELAEAFWGEPQTLDTSNLHFVFRSKDRAAVEQLAPGAEALYVTLRQATGQALTEAGRRLTVEIVPGRVLPGKELVNGHMRLPSPLLFNLINGYTSEQVLAYLTRITLTNNMLDSALHNTSVKPQWQQLAEDLRLWLLESSTLPLASSADCTTCRRQANSYSALPLRDLLDCYPCRNITFSHSSTLFRRNDLPRPQQQAIAVRNLINFIVSTYGLDVWPALLRGFSQHEDWESLAPDVFGVSAIELEAAWHAAWRKCQAGFSCRVPSRQESQ